MTVNEGDLWAIYLGGMTKRANAFVMQTFSNFVPCQTTIMARPLIVRHKKDSCEGTFSEYSQDVFQVQVCWSPGERGVQRLTKQERANNLLIEDDQLTSTVPAVAYQSLGQASSKISIYIPIFQNPLFCFR